MSQQRQALGAWGEEQAVAYLRARGIKILKRNYRTPVGEIDIVAREKKLLLFIEVKTRRGTAFGTPQEAVGYRKQQQIIRTAHWYLAREKTRGLQPRFDVLAVLCQSGEAAQITYLPDAFALAD